MVGNHANGEAARHQLVSVSEAYQSVLLESQTVRFLVAFFVSPTHGSVSNRQADPILQSRKSDIHRHIAAIHSRGKAVQNLRINIEAQIDEAFRKVMTDIQHITEQKVIPIRKCRLIYPCSFLVNADECTHWR